MAKELSPTELATLIEAAMRQSLEVDRVKREKTDITRDKIRQKEEKLKEKKEEKKGEAEKDKKRDKKDPLIADEARIAELADRLTRISSLAVDIAEKSYEDRKDELYDTITGKKANKKQKDSRNDELAKLDNSSSLGANISSVMHGDDRLSIHKKDDKNKEKDIHEIVQRRLKDEGHKPTSVQFVRFSKEGLVELMLALSNVDLKALDNKENKNKKSILDANKDKKPFSRDTKNTNGGSSLLSKIINMLGVGIAGWTILDAISENGGMGALLDNVKVFVKDIWRIIKEKAIDPIWGAVKEFLGPVWESSISWIKEKFDYYKNEWLTGTSELAKSNFDFLGGMVAMAVPILTGVLYRIPFIGTALLAAKSYAEFKQGNFVKGIWSLLQGTFLMVPGIGTALSIGMGAIEMFFASDKGQAFLGASTTGDFLGAILSTVAPFLGKIFTKIPFVGAVVLGALAYTNFKQGNYLTGFWKLLEMVMNIGGNIIFPGFGTAIQVGMGAIEMFFNSSTGQNFMFATVDFFAGIVDSITSFLAKNIYYIPILSTFQYAFDAWDNFSNGEFCAGFSNISRSLYSLIPGLGPLLIKGMSFMETLFTGKTSDKGYEASNEELSWGAKFREFAKEIKDKVFGWILPDNDDGWFGAVGFIKGVLGLPKKGKANSQPVNKTIDNTTKMVNESIEKHAKNIQNDLDKDNVQRAKISEQRRKQETEIAKKKQEEEIKKQSVELNSKDNTVKSIEDMSATTASKQDALLKVNEKAMVNADRNNAALINKMDEFITKVSSLAPGGASGGNYVSNNSSTQIIQSGTNYRQGLRERLT